MVGARLSRRGVFALALTAAAVAAVQTAPCLAQPAPTPAPARPAAVAAPATPRPVPDRLVQLKLIWTVMSAVDQANKSGNYSVLRDLGSPGFQAQNNAASLANVFTPLRNQQVDLADTFLVQPVFDFPAAMVEPDMLRMRGSFLLRPTIRFDLLFLWRDGWRLQGVAIVPEVQAAAPATPAPATPSRPPAGQPPRR